MAEARAKSAAYDYADIPPEGFLNANPIFLAGSRKAHSPSIFHRRQDYSRYHSSHDSSNPKNTNIADANSFTYSAVAWITTSSIQLLYQHILRHHHAERNTTPNPATEFVHAYNPFAESCTRPGNARSTQARSVLNCVHALMRSGRTALCAEEGVDIRFKGWVCARVQTEAEAMAEAVAQAVANMAAGDNRAEGSSVGDACEGGNQAGQESRHDGRVVVARHRQIHGSIVLTLEPYDGLFVYREALKRSEDSPEPRLGRLVF